MSLALIETAAKEARRLAIAGSSLAVGDFRLQKLIAPLEQAGSKTPVFSQAARAIADLINGSEADSPSRLLALSTLLNAILYTQGQTGAEGDFQPLEGAPAAAAQTKTPARVLRPLREALTSAGAGRLEIVKAAFERGVFKDLRLIDPAIQALGDNFPELADLVAEKILPSYGPGIIPRLRAQLDVQGKKSEARKLAVLHQLDPAGAIEFCQTALEDGSPEVKAAALACLGQHEPCLPLVLEYAKSKNKSLRTAALAALAPHEQPGITHLFVELLQGETLGLLVTPFRFLRNRQVLRALVQEGETTFQRLAQGKAERLERFSEILRCLLDRKEPEVEDFLLSCLSRAEIVAKLKASPPSTVTGADVLTQLVSNLRQLGAPKCLAAILAKHQILPSAAFPEVLSSAALSWPPEKVFAEFSPLLEKKRDKEKREDLRRFLASRADDWASPSLPNPAGLDSNPSAAPPAQPPVLDPRWLDAAIAVDDIPLICELARPGHEAALQYLLKLADAPAQDSVHLILHALIRCQSPRATDFFLRQAAKKIKGAKYLDYELQALFDGARFLPASALPQLEAFAAEIGEKFADPLLEAISPLRAAPPPALS